MKFGEILKNLRIEKRLTLRHCADELGIDPSNWSKIERGVNPAPKDIAVLGEWAAFFSLSSERKEGFFDAAALSRNVIPADFAADEQMMAKLPAFFRVARDNELSGEKLDRFLRDFKELHTPDNRNQL